MVGTTGPGVQRPTLWRRGEPITCMPWYVCRTEENSLENKEF
jgi:hypothetical protein